LYRLAVVCLALVFAAPPTLGSHATQETQSPNWIDSIAKWRKPKPVDHDVKACPAVGRGTQSVDTVTDLRKNRTDTTNSYHSVPFDAVVRLPAQGLPRRRHLWTDSDTARVAKYEGVPIVVNGYLAEAMEEGKEETNCGIDTHPWHDWHVWLVSRAIDGTHAGRSRAIVVEVTPRIRPAHPEWSLDLLHTLQRTHQHVRVSGWLMLDPDHPDMVGQTRATIWEIHPVTRIEVQDGSSWRPIK
jgi:hypothetical protein